jgi:hypothetical protein
MVTHLLSPLAGWIDVLVVNSFLAGVVFAVVLGVARLGRSRGPAQRRSGRSRRFRSRVELKNSEFGIRNSEFRTETSSPNMKEKSSCNIR